METPTAAPTALPQSTPAENEACATFQTLMWALSNPGRVFTLPGSLFSTCGSCQSIGAALLDLETSFYTPDILLRQIFEQTGAHFLDAARAAYLFFPEREVFESPMLQTTLNCIEQAQVGTLTDPDQSATLIIACLLGEGKKFQLQGPGIRTNMPLIVDELPLEFWQLRNEKTSYPLGFDIFLVDGDQVVGIPRSTLLEIE